MGELMSSITSAIFTIIGGLIAGGIGYTATIVSIREHRKERHLEEHKNNLKNISKALDRIFEEVWIFVGGADLLKVPRPPFGNEKWVANVEIKKVSFIMDMPGSFSGDSRTVPLQVGINNELYDDINAHFQLLDKLLRETEQEVKKNGKRLLELLNSLSSLTYKKMGESDINFPYWDGSKTVLKKFSDLKVDVIEQDYAGSIFLMVVGEDEDNWPNKVRWLRNNNVYDELKRLSGEIKKEFGDNLDQLLGLRGKLVQLINETKEEINRVELTTRLKGRCRYL